MLTERQKEALLKLAPNIKFNEPLSQHAYFGIGGPAEAFLTYQHGVTFGILKKVLKFCSDEKIEVTVLGAGSNVLVSDKGLSGLVLRLDGSGTMITSDFPKEEPVTIQVLAGCSMQKLVKFTMSIGLTGLEPFLGLPGTVGGAVYNNAHFKRHQLFGNFVTKVWTIPFPLYNLTEEHFYRQEDMKFAYDYSVFQSLPRKEIIITVEVALKKGNKVEIETLAEKLMQERKNSQPLDLPSSGCIFKNPNPYTSAGELVDTAGLKGFRIGGAEVSAKHANFIVNPEKKATAADVLALIAYVKNEVRKRHGVLLEEEIFFLDNEEGVIK